MGKVNYYGNPSCRLRLKDEEWNLYVILLWNGYALNMDQIILAIRFGVQFRRVFGIFHEYIHQ